MEKYSADKGDMMRFAERPHRCLDIIGRIQTITGNKYPVEGGKNFFPLICGIRSPDASYRRYSPKPDDMHRTLQFILASILGCLPLIARAQAQRLGWSTNGHVGFVYQISNNEAQKLLTKPKSDSIFRRLLHTQVDTFRTSKGWQERPTQGHFIVARIVENTLRCEYLGILPYQVFLLREYNSLTLQVIDRDGKVRSDAKVRLKHSRIPFDTSTHTYRMEDNSFYGDRRYVSVELDGFRSFFEVVRHERPYWAPSYYQEDKPEFYSYMLTDKNRYRPGDKVRFKSYALSRSRSPLRKPLELWLTGGHKRYKLGNISPHRPGSYADEFILHDSLNLSLDQNYMLELHDPHFRIFASCHFKYEDYELNGDRLEVLLEHSQHYYPRSNKLIIRATNINGLPLAGARARIIVRPENVQEMFQPLLYVPDTLYYEERELGYALDTEVDIPAGVFAKANIGYTAEVTLLSQTNQQLSRTVAAVFRYNQYQIEATLKGDSIQYQSLNNGVPMSEVEANLLYHPNNESRKIMLPFREKINPTISEITVSTPHAVRKIDMESLLPRLEIRGGIERDSFRIYLYNPNKLPVTWNIYQGSHLLDDGFGETISHQSLITDRTISYYVEVLYPFACKDRIKQMEYRFNDKALKIDLQLPGRVYPGQTLDATIRVTNEAGSPVPGVDLTALASNSKLGYQPALIPDYGTLSAKRTEAPTFENFRVHTRTGVLPLDYSRWANRAGLDTMKYYQLLYPTSKMFVHQTPVSDSTQFVVYVMQKGVSRKVFVVEVNHEPVYFSWVSGPSRYVHYVAPDKWGQVALRLADRVLLLDSLCFGKGYKTILSVDLDHLPANARVLMIDHKSVKKSRAGYPHFTKTERQRYIRYLAGFGGVGKRAFLRSPSQFVPLNSNSGRRYEIAGPITSGMLQYIDSDRSLEFRIVGGNAYVFEDGIVYRENVTELMPEFLEEEAARPSLTMNQVVLARNEYLSRDYVTKDLWITRNIEVVERSRKLSILLPEDKDRVGVYTVLYEHPTTGKIISTCPSWEQRHGLYVLPEGHHHVIVLYNDGRYLKMENVLLKSRIHTYIDFSGTRLNEANDSSKHWREQALGNCFDRAAVRSLTLHRPFNRYGGNVHGTILDDMGMPIPGVNVVVKGTTIGAVTDVDGNFALDIYDGYAILAVSFIGYKSEEVEVRAGSVLSLQMQPDITQLQEVVVVGYGVMARSELAYSVSSVLQGRVAGVQISNRNEGDLSESENDETNERAEDQFYQDLMLISGIRSNFTDVAIWEPKLYTDKKGTATFPVTFPDDITQWDASVFAMNRRLQSGVVRKSIRSFKPIMAELDVPRFMVKGDSAFAHGSISNNSTHKIVNGTFRWDAPGATSDSTFVFEHFKKYLLPLYGLGRDSLETKFVFIRDDGYTDGEVRRMPLVEQGTVRAKGILSILANGDQKNIKAIGNERVSVEIMGGVTDIWTGEARYLINYKYACNEQLASKLLGLIAYRNMTRYEEKEFPYERQVRDIIKRLLKNQNEEFLWSWWDVSSNTSYWISAHVLRALKAARDAGYQVDLNIENITRKATYKYDMLDSFTPTDADLLQALAEWNAKLDFNLYATRIDSLLDKTEKYFIETRQMGYSTIKERLLLAEVRQLAGLPFDRTLFTRYRREGARGELFLSDGRQFYNWYGDDLTANTVAYRMVRRDSTLREMLLPMQMYFLSQRAVGGWNTYHSANVLISILPDLLEMGATKRQPVRIEVSGSAVAKTSKTAKGDHTTTYTTLPVIIDVGAGEELHVDKKEGLPVYFMEYIEETVTNSTTAGDVFEIETELGNGVGKLIAGQRVKMVVNVSVMKDVKAEYVMIEVPIPASCSYIKNDPRSSEESHREYYRDRVNIYFERMSTGIHRLEIELLPRFSGVFHVNPAQVSFMYVPVINANNSLSVVHVSVQD